MQQDDEFYFLADKDDLPKKLCYNKGYFYQFIWSVRCQIRKKIPHVLMILDGIGHREETKDNAVAVANTPNLDALFASYPNGLISGSGMDVGLPEGQFGNSEVGHMNLGAGRILFQDSTRIMNEIASGEFF